MKSIFAAVFSFVFGFSVFASTQAPLKVAVYVDNGSYGIGASEWVRIVDESEDMAIKLVDGASVRAGALTGQDVLVMPGGSSKKQTAALGPEGCKIVKDFLKNGGGFVGTCAGICVLMDEPIHRLNVIPYKSVGYVGLMYAYFDLNEQGAKMLGTKKGLHKVRYNGGPILAPTTNKIEGASFEVWGTYGFEGGVKGKVKKECKMLGAPAFIGGTYGKGRVFGTVAHPEYYDSTLYLIQGAFKYVTGRDVKFPKRLHKRGAVTVGFDVSRMKGINTSKNILALANSKDVNFIALDENMIFRRGLDYVDVFVYTISLSDSRASKAQKQVIADFISRGGKVVFVGADASKEPAGVVASGSGDELVKTIKSL